jgi:hypothetical protein
MGAPDILSYVPPDVFVDCRKYETWTDMWQDVATYSPSAIADMRAAGRDFLKSDRAKRFYDSMEYIFET